MLTEMCLISGSLEQFSWNLLSILFLYWGHENTSSNKVIALANISKHPSFNSFPNSVSIKFHLELFIFIAYFSTVVPVTSCVFFPVGLSSKRHFQQILKFLLSINFQIQSVLNSIFLIMKKFLRENSSRINMTLIINGSKYLSVNHYF